MANEASIIENPTSTPAAVSTGYQRQNTLITGIMNGIDRTVVDGGAGGVTVQISGPVDVNGVLYAITSAATLACPAAGKYIVYLDGTTGTLTPTLDTTLGTFDDSKNARYTAGGKRILNWLIFYDGTTAYVNRWVTPESANDNNYLPDLDTPPETWITTTSTWTAPRTKYYTIEMVGRGGDGGGAGGVAGGGGGGGGIKRIKIDAGDVWSASMSTSAGGNTQFSNGVTTLIARNANQQTPGGIVSNANSGLDVNFGGAYGNWASTYGANTFGGIGGSSIYGGGGLGSTTLSGNNAECYGAGGGGSGSGAGNGAGGSGAIHIIG